jgi:hypothetical protein
MPAKKKVKENRRTLAAQLLGHFGGLHGGPARAEKLSKERRVEIAKMGNAASKRSRGVE